MIAGGVAGAGLLASGRLVRGGEPVRRSGVRIARVEAFPVRGAVFVKATADDGHTGWGEAGHSGGALVARVVEGVLAELVVGRDVFDAEATWSRTQ